MAEKKSKFNKGDRVKSILEDSKVFPYGEEYTVEGVLLSMTGMYLYKLIGKQNVAQEIWLERSDKDETKINRK